MPDLSAIDPLRSALFTDLYELTMVRAYEREGMHAPAVFELFFREMPPERNYILAAGLDDVLAALEALRVGEDDVDWLSRLEQFPREFAERLRDFRFTGDVWAVPEGTPVFPNEPLIQVIAPLPEAQLVETLILNQINFQSIAATKAARVVTAAGGRTVVDFGSRRAHGSDAALKVARTSYLAGAAGTSNVLAGKLYGVPVFGTMAHSYVQAHEDERAAFAAFSELYEGTTLLVDTYDTLQGVRRVIDLARQQGERFNVRAVRLDSGDLAALAKETRRMFDEAGLPQVEIFASSGLDEYSIRDLLRQGAPIDGFGVGTHLAVSDDAPALDMAYKLVEYAGRPRTKLSSHKVIYPGRKQVFRVIEAGRMIRDVIGCHDERLSGEPLLNAYMIKGKRTPGRSTALEDARRRARSELARLPDACLSIDPAAEPYPVEISRGLQEWFESVRATLAET